ncbi:AAA family ATPase [Marinobacter sp. G11]|uniref:AAA family ATPase n=1 Tax=Marinobacter sp. G11 TaxID=2903522 RepID=UPI001E5E2652|nr:AAA family ATPase [Marinobacter sp. G11]MCE0757724.1 AAA family ATPase [Marinobacter sp. G11]
MGKTLTDIAKQLSTPRQVRSKKTTKVQVTAQVPKVQIIYAFNGTGKTRLSREFKRNITSKISNDGDQTSPREKILYYNAFTEDLFYWDNDLEGDSAPKLKIQPNTYTDWLLTLLKDLGQDANIIKYFQHYANDKLTPHFSEDLTEVAFSLERGDNEHSGNLKISKGEESNFIWSIFYTLLDQVITILNVAEPTERETNQFDQLEYVFIDDPVSSLDENHLIELAVNLAGLIKSSQSGLKFIITTHSPLFYNVLHNELGLNKNGKKEGCYLLERFENGSYLLNTKYGDSNQSFSYHLYLKQVLEQAVAENQVQRYHFTLLRNLYEKTASFLGYPKWSELLPGDQQAYLNRIIQFSSHSTLTNDTVTEPTEPEKQTVKLLLNHLKNEYGFWKQVEAND